MPRPPIVSPEQPVNTGTALPSSPARCNPPAPPAPPRTLLCAASIKVPATPLSAGAPASEHNRWRGSSTSACFRSAAFRYTLRELSASPSSSRTIGHTTIFVPNRRSDDHPAQHCHLRRILLSEESKIGFSCNQELCHHSGHSAKMSRARRAIQSLAHAFHINQSSPHPPDTSPQRWERRSWSRLRAPPCRNPH